MKKYDGLKIKIICLSKEDVITASNIVLPDDNIGDDVPNTFE